MLPQPVRSFESVVTTFGEYPKVKFCQGYEFSKNRGMDTPCCINCNIIRRYLLQRKAFMMSSPMYKEYMEIFSNEMLKKNPDAKIHCAMTTCSGKPMIFVVNKPDDIFSDVFSPSLMMQVLLMHKLKLVNRVITDDMLAYTSESQPVVLPNQDTEKRDEYGGDEGVTIKNGILSIVDRKLAFESGKWMHVINYYECIERIFPDEDKVPWRIDFGKKQK